MKSTAGIPCGNLRGEVRPNGSAFYVFGKRAFDLVLSAAALALLLLPMLLIGLMVVLDSPGPALYTQDRLGLWGKSFTIFKFRTMVTDAEKDGPRLASGNDERCTRLGRFLRKSRLDELPQLWNILRGEMSFVGPRPEREFFYRRFEPEIPGFRSRLAVKPGLTGLAQVDGGYRLPHREKIVYDLRYIENCSLRMDLYCIFKTFGLVFGEFLPEKGKERA